MRLRFLIAATLLSATALAAEIPTVSADMGQCSARFTVTDGTKPIYNAKVRTRIRHGVFGARKLDLEIGTNADGQALISGLPELPKRPIAFEIIKEDVSRTVLFEPEKACNPEFEIALRRPERPLATPPADDPQP